MNFHVLKARHRKRLLLREELLEHTLLFLSSCSNSPVFLNLEQNYHYTKQSPQSWGRRASLKGRGIRACLHIDAWFHQIVRIRNESINFFYKYAFFVLQSPLTGCDLGPEENQRKSYSLSQNSGQR